METLPVGCGKNAYRVVTIAVNEYENQQVVGSIHHDALEGSIEFHGWIDFMKIVNQIYDVTKVPKQTVNMRSFGPVRQRELHWRQSEEEVPHTQARGRRATFRILLKYRYYASWQGTITWLEGDRTYTFASFLNLLKVMDSTLLKRELGNMEVLAPGCICQIDVNRYDNSIIQGALQQTATNYRRDFSGVMDLAWNLSELTTCSMSWRQSNGKLISGESLGYCRRGGKEGTFAVRILFGEHSTWQGMIYCREWKEEKPFRSFMEMLYLMASALDAGAVWGVVSNNFDSVNQDYIESYS